MERVINTDRVSAPSAVSDKELVARCQAGDEAAFDELVLRHQQRAFNIAYPLLLNHEDATEVAQDAFVRVYRNINEFRGDCEFTTWLYQIVMNLARNKHRWWKRRGRHATVSLDCPKDTPDGEVAMQVAATTDAPDAEAAKAEFMQRLNDKMTELPAKLREAVLLRDMDGMRYEEIARMLGCSVGTVKSRIARGREQLRDQMRQE